MTIDLKFLLFEEPEGGLDIPQNKVKHKVNQARGPPNLERAKVYQLNLVGVNFFLCQE